MSEKIYLWLWRLYPSRFRDAYRVEALQLFRDRAFHEKGFLPTLRLWLDLVADLAISMPSEYVYTQPALATVSSRRSLNGVPSFCVLQRQTPHLGPLLYGGVLSLVIFAAMPGVIGYGGNHQIAGLRRHLQFPKGPGSSAFGRPARTADNNANETARLSGERILAAIRFGSSEVEDDGFHSNPLEQRQSSGAPQEQSPPLQPGSGGVAADENVKLDAAQRHRLIEAASTNLRQYYFDRKVGQATADALLAHAKNGEDAVAKGEQFAALVTKQMQDASHDMHLSMDYSPDPLPEHPPEDTPESVARFRSAMEREHCMIRKVEIMRHGIGYMKLDFFPDVSVCESTATAAMASLNNADALIFDLRDNRGGFESMVSLIASYLFDHPEYMYSPREAPSERSWTHSPVPGNKLADKPVYVLTSASTWSGAEQFSYDLKMLRRATLVGETTRGGALAGEFHRIDEHFFLGIPEVKPINPYGEADWEGIGVEPDVRAKAADALEVAKGLAATRLQKRSTMENSK
jgi:hypothetical protein